MRLGGKLREIERIQGREGNGKHDVASSTTHHMPHQPPSTFTFMVRSREEEMIRAPSLAKIAW